jgi:hypothetical protein
MTADTDLRRIALMRRWSEFVTRDGATVVELRPPSKTPALREQDGRGNADMLTVRLG